jgi:hypothetical protein
MASLTSSIVARQHGWTSRVKRAGSMSGATVSTARPDLKYEVGVNRRQRLPKLHTSLRSDARSAVGPVRTERWPDPS